MAEAFVPERFPNTSLRAARLQGKQAEEASLIRAGVEIDGARLNRGGGRTFAHHAEGSASDDVHGFALSANRARTVFAATKTGVHTSDDEGNWTFQKIGSEWHTRSVRGIDSTLRQH